MIRPSIPEDAVALAGRLREADKREVEALSGSDPLAALTMGYMHSELCMTGLNEKRDVVVMYGVVPFRDDPKVGAIWLLSADDIRSSVREFVANAKPWLAEQLKKYRVLTNIVTADNDLHIRMIKYMGFTFGEPLNNYGAGNVRAVPFYIQGDTDV